MKKIVSVVLAAVMVLMTAVTVFAAVPSPSYEPQVEAVGYENADGELVFAEIIDAEGNVIASATEADAIVLRFVSYEDASEELAACYADLKARKNLVGLCDELTEIAGKKIKNLAVSDVFEVVLSDELAEVLAADPANTLSFKVKADVDDIDAIYALGYADGEWTLNGTADGETAVITVTIGADGIIAIVLETASIQTGVFMYFGNVINDVVHIIFNRFVNLFR